MNNMVLNQKLAEIVETLNVIGADASDQGLYIPAGSNETQALIDHIRMQVKYLSFDLEASQRENRYLRKMLEFKPPMPPAKPEEENPFEGF